MSTTDIADPRPGKPARDDRSALDKPMPRWLNILVTAPIILGTLAIAGIGFFGSFHGMQDAARPYLGDQAWTAPAGIDTAILVLTAYDLRAIRANVSVPWLRYVILALNLVTIGFNSAADDRWMGKAFHAMMPVLYIVIVEAIRTSLSRWVAKTHDEHVEPIPWNMWLTPVSTFRMWYRRNRWRVRTIDELVRREQARELAVMRLKERSGKLHRRWVPKWQKEASADELWAIRTYALSPDGAMRKTAAAVTKETLAAGAGRPAPPHEPAREDQPVHARQERARTAASVRVHAQQPGPAPEPAPARTGAQGSVHGDAQPPARTAGGSPEWEKLMRDPEAARAWEVYRRLRAETGERPGRKQVHEEAEVSKDVTAVSRWLKQFDKQWTAAPARTGVHEPAPEPEPVRETVREAAPAPVHDDPQEGVHSGAPVHAQPDGDVHDAAQPQAGEGVHAPPDVHARQPEAVHEPAPEPEPALNGAGPARTG